MPVYIKKHSRLIYTWLAADEIFYSSYIIHLCEKASCGTAERVATRIRPRIMLMYFQKSFMRSARLSCIH